MQDALEHGTCRMALLDTLRNQIAGCILKRPADNGRRRRPEGLPKMIACRLSGVRRPIELAPQVRPRSATMGGTVLSLGPRKPRSPPRSRSGRAPARHPRDAKPSPGPGPLSVARYPRHAAWPVRQHRRCRPGASSRRTGSGPAAGTPGSRLETAGSCPRPFQVRGCPLLSRSVRPVCHCGLDRPTLNSNCQ